MSLKEVIPIASLKISVVSQTKEQLDHYDYCFFDRQLSVHITHNIKYVESNEINFNATKEK